MAAHKEVGRVYSRCQMSDGTIKDGVLPLYSEGDKWWASYEIQRVGGKHLAKLLSLNPELLKRTYDPKVGFVYSGLIVLPKIQAN